MDLLLAFARLRDIVGRLHPHQRIPFDAKGFFNAERRVSGEIGLSVEQAGSGRTPEIFGMCQVLAWRFLDQPTLLIWDVGQPEIVLIESRPDGTTKFQVLRG